MHRADRAVEPAGLERVQGRVRDEIDYSLGTVHDEFLLGECYETTLHAALDNDRVLGADLATATTMAEWQRWRELPISRDINA
ncbi:MAG: hypothetical protein WBM50_01460 [Acidimicrobiales bacterium]